MKTMIPNEVRFGIDLNDLPARATQASSEALSLTGGACIKAFNRGKTVGGPDQGNAKRFCEPTCRYFGKAYTGEFGFQTISTIPPLAYRIDCRCC
jgi:hypothetical protein